MNSRPPSAPIGPHFLLTVSVCELVIVVYMPPSLSLHSQAHQPLRVNLLRPRDPEASGPRVLYSCVRLVFLPTELRLCWHIETRHISVETFKLFRLIGSRLTTAALSLYVGLCLRQVPVHVGSGSSLRQVLVKTPKNQRQAEVHMGSKSRHQIRNKTKFKKIPSQHSKKTETGPSQNFTKRHPIKKSETNLLLVKSKSKNP